MEGVFLRAVHPDDAPALAALYTRPKVRHGTLRLPFQRQSFFESRIKNLTPGTTWIVAETEAEGTVVGEAGLMVRTGRQSHRGDILVAVHDDHWGRGIGRALCENLLDVADNWLGLRRVQLEVYVDNTRAIALYRALGFEEEGVLRADSIRDGVLMDAVLMGRLRDPIPHRRHAED